MLGIRRLVCQYSRKSKETSPTFVIFFLSNTLCKRSEMRTHPKG
ncbi:hypothetical protein LEP1GSC199_0819 [Leptospira vanthielii serovar Holland str. Waz Holland = ATCC 700522]|uniref:Uncharacterized protein n=1 Tax=Leptospira vanthielii serovar Holland str. Waz Holland = ATCC 700522 TaxID=1218591 RepID=N1VWB1_9LEPT|nr:hypothetical protein LEP1GSC199_0819 [Leptospira vanthielii serovar Holland str. Waz Holland = ATCC 700522]